MATRISPDNWQEWTDEPASNGEKAEALKDAQNSASSEDSLTGLPWTETLLPLVMNWAAVKPVHVVCLHFVGLGLLAGLQEFQSSPSLLHQAAQRLDPLMGDDDRLSILSGNKLLVFTKRSPSEIQALLAVVHERLGSLGTEINGHHVPETRVGRSVLGHHDAAPITVEALNSLITRAAEETIPMEEVMAAPRATAEVSRWSVTAGSEDQPATRTESEAAMIIRGHPERTPVRPRDESATPRAVSQASPNSEHRLILKAVDVQVTGLVATALVDLDFEGRKVRGKAIGRSVEQHQAALVGEAMTRAITDLLPAGHGAVFRQAVPVSTEFGDALVSVVEFLSPESNEFLFGVAPVDGEVLTGIAKSILSALNHRTARLLDAEE